MKGRQIIGYPYKSNRLLVNMSVGSLPGTSGLLGTTVWPLAAKKSRKLWRISATEINGVDMMGCGKSEQARKARPAWRDI